MQSACVVLYCHLWPVRLYHVCKHSLTNGTILGNNVTEHKMRVLVFSINLSERLLILRRIQRGSVINIHTYVFMQIFLSDFNQNWIFSVDFRKYIQISNFIKILPVGTELVRVEGRTDGQRDMMQPIVAFRNFAKAD
jgi:hypothetical protein